MGVGGGAGAGGVGGVGHDSQMEREGCRGSLRLGNAYADLRQKVSASMHQLNYFAPLSVQRHIAELVSARILS